MLAGAQKVTQNSHFSTVCLSLLDGMQTTKVTNRTRNRFPSLHPPLWIYIFKSFALMFNLEIQRYRYMFCRTGRANGEEQGEKKGKNKAGSG